MSENMEELVHEMLSAVEADIESLDKGQPGLAKLSLVSQVEEQTSKQALQDSFIDAGGLSAIREWLRLLPDQSLPNLTLRTSMLKILQKLTPSITLESLKESKVGHALRDIIFHEEEISGNKRIANEIAESWLRSIFGRDTDMVTVTKATEGEMRRAAAVARTVDIAQPEDRDDLLEEEGGRKSRRSAFSTLAKHASKESHLFKVQPSSRINPARVQSHGGGMAGDRIQRTLTQKATRQSKAGTSKVSVEGRGLQ
jgi:hypothetical protein